MYVGGVGWYLPMLLKPVELSPLDLLDLIPLLVTDEAVVGDVELVLFAFDPQT